MINYPNSLDGTAQFSQPTGSSLLTGIDHAAQHDNLSSLGTVLQAILGTTPGTNLLRNVANPSDQILVANSGGTVFWTLTGGTQNKGVFGTPAITGGTINNAVMGTPGITGGSHNAGVFGTPSVVGGTVNASLNILGSHAYSPGTSTTGTIDLSTGNRFLVNLPATAGSITLAVINGANNQPFLIEALQGAAGNGTINWFGSINWINNGTAAPTQGTTPGRKATYGFIQTGAGTFDGYQVGVAE
jgi:hypothetical protein